MWTKRILYASVLVLSGCMTTEARWNTEQVLAMKTDCSDPNQQQMLESQRVTRNDYIKNGLILSSLLGSVASLRDGTYQERRNLSSGARTTAQRLRERNRRIQCEREAYYKSLNLR